MVIVDVRGGEAELGGQVRDDLGEQRGLPVLGGLDGHGAGVLSFKNSVRSVVQNAVLAEPGRGASPVRSRDRHRAVHAPD